MLSKQHRGLRNKVLAVLFLFFNCVCAAAPVLKLAGENDNHTISVASGPLENEEENHAASAYINQFPHLSVGKHSTRRVGNNVDANSARSLAVVDVPETCISNAGFLPIRSNHVFLFRYTLF